jgi:hypothetical protein
MIRFGCEFRNAAKSFGTFGNFAIKMASNPRYDKALKNQGFAL